MGNTYTMPDGYTCEYHESIDSTNVRAKHLAAKGCRAGSVVIAGSQSAGRGRLGRSFISPEGSGIYMSIVFRPDMKVSDAVKITAFAAVCVCDAIDTLFGTHCTVKWVNDIIINGKKICGILAESGFGTENGKPDFTVLGIGINLKKGKMPEEIREIAASVEDFSKLTASKEELVYLILENLSPLLSNRIPEDTMDRYRRRSMILGKEVYALNDPTLCGIAESIDQNGGLVIKNHHGIRRTVSSGEVSIRLKKT